MRLFFQQSEEPCTVCLWWWLHLEAQQKKKKAKDVELCRPFGCPLWNSPLEGIFFGGGGGRWVIIITHAHNKWGPHNKFWLLSDSRAGRIYSQLMSVKDVLLCGDWAKKRGGAATIFRKLGALCMYLWSHTHSQTGPPPNSLHTGTIEKKPVFRKSKISGAVVGWQSKYLDNHISSFLYFSYALPGNFSVKLNFSAVYVCLAQSIGRMGRPRAADAANICLMAIEINVFHINPHTQPSVTRSYSPLI